MSDASGIITDKKTRAIIIFCVVLATMMQTLDSTIANVALPHIQGALSGNQEQIAWILTSYIVAAAITIPLAGWLAGYFGRKRVLLSSILGFVIASVLCGISTDLPEMVVFRFLQGVCGAALIPLSQVILLNITPKEDYGKAMAIWGFGVTMGPILGPLLGGYLTEDYNRRWVFFINVPIGFVAFVGLTMFLTETKTQKSAFDFFGFLTLSIGVGALQLMLDRGSIQDWFTSVEIITEAIISALGFYLFVIHVLTRSKSFLNLELFKDRNFTVAVILIFIVGVSLFATLALLPAMLQNLFNYPVITTGAVTAAQGTGTMLAMLIVGHLLKRFDPRYVIGCGIAMVAFALWQMTHYSLLMSSTGFILPGMIQGFGTGLCFIPLGAVAFSNLTSELHNEGTSFFNLMRNLGSSIGISAVEAFLTSNTQIAHALLGQHLTAYNSTNNLAYKLSHVDLTHSIGLKILDVRLTQQATMIAYINDFYLIMIVTLIVLPLIFFLRKTEKNHTPAIGIE
ncbi:MAG: DHA2 family efflux MFS transporter permease subunit [Pseudomonadota bacterium]